MRILHVVHQYVPDHVAGTELYTQMVARAQAAAGHEVAVFTPLNRAGAFDGRAAPAEGVRVYRVPAGERGATAVFLSTFRQPALAEAFAAVLAAERPDVVHVQHLMGLPAAAGAALRDAGVPYVLALHDYWYGCANGQLLTNDTAAICAGPSPHFGNCGRCAAARGGLPAALGPFFAPLMARRNARLAPVFAGAARVLAPNAFVAEVYAALGFPAGRIVVNPLGLDAPPGLAGRVVARRAARPPGPPRFGYVGSIARQKGVHVLVEALNGLPDGAATLDVYGDMSTFPAYAAELRALARHPGIRFHGLLGRDRLWDALADLDALVLPTLWYEASPLVIREAFAAKLPIIASALGAPGRMVRDGVDGLLFAPGDTAALRQALLALVEQPALLARLRAGIAPVRTVADHVAQIEAVYEEIKNGTRMSRMGTDEHG
jgi:glycosyltransferase involved in cell wall biosynthesis